MCKHIGPLANHVRLQPTAHRDPWIDDDPLAVLVFLRHPSAPLAHQHRYFILF